jgi:hypothetical protein
MKTGNYVEINLSLNLSGCGSLEIALPKVLFGKAHCHYVKSISPAKDLAVFDGYIAIMLGCVCFGVINS